VRVKLIKVANVPLGRLHNLPGAKVIGSGVEIPDMIWIGEVFRTALTENLAVMRFLILSN
jgi:hypothetical protein